jgi:hypothetical protein
LIQSFQPNSRKSDLAGADRSPFYPLHLELFGRGQMGDLMGEFWGIKLPIGFNFGELNRKDILQTLVFITCYFFSGIKK